LNPPFSNKKNKQKSKKSDQSGPKKLFPVSRAAETLEEDKHSGPGLTGWGANDLFFQKKKKEENKKVVLPIREQTQKPFFSIYLKLSVLLFILFFFFFFFSN
jgi:hypothetical protein